MFKTIRNLKKFNQIVDWVMSLLNKVDEHKDEIKRLKNKVNMLVDEIRELKEKKVENANSTPTM